MLKEPSIYETILDNNCMSLLPIVIEKGIQSHTVLSPSKKDLRILLSKLKNRFSIVQLKELSTTPLNAPINLLSSKQTETLRTAYLSGYYEIPRRKSVTEIAIETGIARVTFQERLRRAENRIIKKYISEAELSS
jgi:predicted DNA binding protein